MGTDLIAEEVSRLVRDAAAGGRLLNAWREAERVFALYPAHGRTVRQIAQLIVEMSAGVAGISIELGADTPNPCKGNEG
jgi:hypothetical protein